MQNVLVGRGMTEPHEKSAPFPNVARALKELRQAHHLTQEQMAPILGLSFAGYRPYERSERDLTQSQIVMIATALKIPVSDITSRLWPEDHKLVETRYSADWDEFREQIAGLPEVQRERLIRQFRMALEIAYGAENLVRRN